MVYVLSNDILKWNSWLILNNIQHEERLWFQCIILHLFHLVKLIVILKRFVCFLMDYSSWTAIIKNVKLHKLLAYLLMCAVYWPQRKTTTSIFFLEERNSSLINEHLLSYWKQLPCYIRIFAYKVCFLKRVVVNVKFETSV